MNSTAFSYQIPSAVSFGTPVRKTSADITYKSLLCAGDYNGDGKTDFLCLPDATKGATWTGIRVYLGDGNDNFSTYFSNSTTINLSQLKDLRAIDLNSDGKDDFVYETGTTSSNYYYMLSNGNSLSNPVLITTRTPSTYSGISGKKRRFIDKLEDDNEVTGADYNGDGAYDICINDAAGNCSVYSLVSPSGMMTSTMYSKGGIAGSTITGEVITGDFNGDGKDDIWSIESTGTKIYTLVNSSLVLIYTSSFPSSNHFFNFGDFNSDGKTDVFVYGTKSGSSEVDWSGWQLQISTGAGFDQILVPQKKINLKDDYVRVADLDGDGTSDLMVTSPDLTWTGTYYYISKNNGTDFTSHSLLSYPTTLNSFYLADFNGDARTDIICTDAQPTWWSGYDINKTAGNTEILLEKVSNGLGSLAKLSYTKISQASSSVYQKGSGATFPVADYLGNTTVVTSIQNENGKGGFNTISYYYEGLKTHLQGKGFLCYSKTRTTDIANNIDNESLFGYNTTYYYPKTIKSYQKRTNTNDTISRTSYTWNQILLSATPKRRIFPYIEKTYSINKLTGHAVVDSTGFDSYGNPTIIKKRYSNGPTQIVNHNYENIVATTKWLLGRPTGTTIQYSKTGNTTITRSGTRIFDPNNNHLISETWHAGSENHIKHRYEYWGYGSIKKQVDSIRSAVLRTQEYTYNSERTNVLTVKDPNNNVTTNSYDNFGRLYTITDYIGNIITYGYDELGRQSSVTSSFGSQNSSIIAWENPGSIPKPARYSIVSNGNDGSQKKQWFDEFGREIRSDIKGFNGTMIYKVTKYNIKGQVDSVSDPYYSNGTAQWNRMIYDNYGRNTNLFTPSVRNSTWSYSGNTITEVTAGKTFTKAYSSDGSINSASDAGGVINYYYYPDGSIKSISAPGGITTSMEYDLACNQTKLTDPSAGIITYTYDGFGRLKSQTNSKNQSSSFNYHTDGRIQTKTTPEGTTNYSYNANEQLTTINSPGNISRSFTYFSNGMVNTITDTIPGSSPFVTTFTYDTKGRLSSTTHPSGIVETNAYNSNGYLSSISAGGATRWTVTALNAFQQFTSGTYGSNLNTNYSRDNFGNLTAIVTGSNQICSYDINDITGNLMMRQNVLQGNIQENFEYDILDRLDRVYRGSTTLQDMSYHAQKGGITAKSDMGTMNYNLQTKPYSLSSISPSTGIITPVMNDSLTYTSFESIKTINEGNYGAVFDYNSNGNRAKMTVMNGSSHVVTRWYPTSRFMKDSINGNVKKYTYIGGDAYSAPVVAVITNNGAPVYYYLLRDHLGSITHIVNTSNTVVAEYSYDAWGRMRNPTTWVAYAPGQEPALMIADRGFTGHEHLPWFKVINMNGRLYDPLTGQFLSADPYVQNPESTQNFNRYTYCLNNPLKFSDPSGYIFKPKEELDPPLYYYSSGCAPLGAFSYNGADIRYYETHTFVSDNNGGGQWVANSDVAEYIWNSDNGGRWSPNGNAYTFSSSDEAMAWGIEYTDENNAWSNTYFGSKEATFLNYFNEAYSGNLLLACLDPGDDPEKKSMDILTFIFSSISDGSEQVMFSNSFNTWMGKDFKIRSQNWGGNGATGGKISFSRSNAKGLDIFGKTLGYYGLWNSLSDGINGKTNVLQTGANAASDFFGIYGGIFGASWSFGWEAGKLWGPSKWGRPKPYQTPTKSRIFD